MTGNPNRYHWKRSRVGHLFLHYGRNRRIAVVLRRAQNVYGLHIVGQPNVETTYPAEELAVEAVYRQLGWQF